MRKLALVLGLILLSTAAFAAPPQPPARQTSAVSSGKAKAHHRAKIKKHRKHHRHHAKHHQAHRHHRHIK